ncbi:cyclin-domain-containing protein [Absidia repens]|uniref:Cyclin-domain-containing protein n=1 Tax=Absidia repens TaxID=90262 RepID=A0A1X2IL50_9FUNG|nr:cyclin-domain-containing protein [Absidia repens]
MVGPQGLFQCLLLSCKDSWQLAELSTCLVSRIWKGTSKRGNVTSTNVFKQFCQKIFQDTQISSGCILLALFYFQELRSIYPTLRGTLGSEFRIFTTALILANKYLDDNTFTNRTWSEVSGIPIHELNIMEMEYLTALDYKLHVHCIQFRSWVSICQQYVETPSHRSLKRSSSTSHYPSPSQLDHHPNKYKSPTCRSRSKHYYDPIYSLSHTSMMYNGAINKKKGKESSHHHNHLIHIYLPRL